MGGSAPRAGGGRLVEQVVSAWHDDHLVAWVAVALQRLKDATPNRSASDHAQVYLFHRGREIAENQGRRQLKCPPIGLSLDCPATPLMMRAALATEPPTYEQNC